MSLQVQCDVFLSVETEDDSLPFGNYRHRLTGGNWVVTSDEALGYRGDIRESQYHLRRDTPNGVLEGESDLRWSDVRTLGASGSETLDLAGGSLIGDFGPVDFAGGRLTYYILASLSGALTLSRPANGVAIFAAVGDSITIPDGGFLAISIPRTPGINVVAGSQDELLITAGAAGCTYEIHLIGTSA